MTMHLVTTWLLPRLSAPAEQSKKTLMKKNGGVSKLAQPKSIKVPKTQWPCTATFPRCKNPWRSFAVYRRSANHAACSLLGQHQLATVRNQSYPASCSCDRNASNIQADNNFSSACPKLGGQSGIVKNDLGASAVATRLVNNPESSSERPAFPIDIAKHWRPMQPCASSPILCIHSPIKAFLCLWPISFYTATLHGAQLFTTLHGEHFNVF